MVTKTAKHTPATKPVSWRVCVFQFWHPFGRQAEPKGSGNDSPSTPQGDKMGTRTAQHTPATKPVSWRVCVYQFWHPFGRHAEPKGTETTPQAPHKETKWAPKRHSTHPPRNHFRGGCAFSRFGTHFDAKRNPERAESEHNAASGRGVGIVRQCCPMHNVHKHDKPSALDTSKRFHFV